MKRALLLPCMMDPKTGNLYFVISQNRQALGWPAGSNKYGIFGGNVRDFESLETTAAREFLEETLGTVLFSEDDNTTQKHHRRIHKLSHRLRTRQVLAVYRSEDWILYLVNVPWDPGCTRRFDHSRSCLSALCSLTRGQELSNDEWRHLMPRSAAKRASRHRWLLSHAATRVTRPERSRRPTVTEVKPWFLEKKSLMLMSAPLLFKVLEDGGSFLKALFHVGTFESKSLEILEIVLGHLRHEHPETVYSAQSMFGTCAA